MSRPSRITINHAALAHNLQRVKHYCPNKKILAIVKANAYGHGITEAIPHLMQADAFGVACVEEAMAIREIAPNKSIVLLEGFFSGAELAYILNNNLQCVIHCNEQLKILQADYSAKKINLKPWLKLNIGMQRLGFAAEDCHSAYNSLQSVVANMQDTVLMGHFSHADDIGNDITNQQLNLFDNTLQDIIVANGSSLTHNTSLANSAAILAWQASHNSSDWVRPGIMLYGIAPFSDENKFATNFDLQSVMQVESALIAIRQCKPGDSIGYNGTYTCDKDMPIGVVAIGYGDGYPRHAKNGAPVLVNGVEVPLVGRISMDMLTVDLSNVPNAKVGDKVILWGEGLAVERVAQSADTIPYELVCHITNRLRG